MHLEVQTSYERDFPERIARYNAGLTWAFQERVVSLVVLADLRKSWCPNESIFEFADFRSRLEFPVCKLVQRLESDWKDDFSLPVQVARAQIEALRTTGSAEDRLDAKWRFVRNLYDMGYTVEELRNLFRLIDWMMHLRPDLDTEFNRRLTHFEEERKMPYVTSIERVQLAEAEARGKAAGEANGRVALAIDFLKRQIGELPESIASQLMALGHEDAVEFSMAAISGDFTDADSITDWLTRHGD